MLPWVLCIGSYLLGAIPFGLLIARWWAGIDVREHGSGNIGATNVYRVVGKPAGILVFTLDVLKGLVPPLVARGLGWHSGWQVGMGLAAMLGHLYSPFLGFRGGKGIATGLGVMFGVAWQVGLVAWAIWGVVVGWSGYVSLGSIIASLSLTPLVLLFYPGDPIRLALVVGGTLLILYKHRANIQRLRNGTESNFKKKRKETEER